MAEGKRFVMPKYVERQKAIEACIRTQKEVAAIISGDGIYHTENAENIANLLKKFEVHVAATPTADVVEVKHGRWDVVTEHDELWGDIDYYKCSLCGNMELRDLQTPYCPNCGARMDGGDVQDT